MSTVQQNALEQYDAYSSYDAFDRTHGTGSSPAVDDVVENSSTFDNEWGSSATTTFKPDGEDAFGEPLPQHVQDKFERLYAFQNGYGEQTRKQDIRQSHIRNDADTFCSVLDVPEPERERVHHILDDLDISSNNFGGRQYEKILLALISLVGDQHLSSRYTATSNEDLTAKRLYNRDEFEALMEATGMSATEHRKIRTQIREKSSAF